MENDLENLSKKFGKKFDLINIENDSVYGYINNKRELLGTKQEYYMYRKLKPKKITRKNDAQRNEEEAHKSFLKSYHDEYESTNAKNKHYHKS